MDDTLVIEPNYTVTVCASGVNHLYGRQTTVLFDTAFIKDTQVIENAFKDILKGLGVPDVREQDVSVYAQAYDKVCTRPAISRVHEMLHRQGCCLQVKASPGVRICKQVLAYLCL
jgi:hypothetical protein